VLLKNTVAMLQYFCVSSHDYYSVCHFVFMSCCAILHVMSGNKEEDEFIAPPQFLLFRRIATEALNFLGLVSSE